MPGGLPQQRLRFGTAYFATQDDVAYWCISAATILGQRNELDERVEELMAALLSQRMQKGGPNNTIVRTIRCVQSSITVGGLVDFEPAFLAVFRAVCVQNNTKISRF